MRYYDIWCYILLLLRDDYDKRYMRDIRYFYYFRWFSLLLYIMNTVVCWYIWYFSLHTLRWLFSFSLFFIWRYIFMMILQRERYFWLFSFLYDERYLLYYDEERFSHACDTYFSCRHITYLSYDIHIIADILYTYFRRAPTPFSRRHDDIFFLKILWKMILLLLMMKMRYDDDISLLSLLFFRYIIIFSFLLLWWGWKRYMMIWWCIIMPFIYDIIKDIFIMITLRHFRRCRAPPKEKEMIWYYIFTLLLPYACCWCLFIFAFYMIYYWYLCAAIQRYYDIV